MAVIITLVVAALIGLFGDGIRGCAILSLLVAIVIYAISEATPMDWLIFGPIFLLGIAVYLGIMIPKWRRKKQEEEKFGRELSENERLRIQEVGEDAWAEEQFQMGKDSVWNYHFTTWLHFENYKRDKKQEEKETEESS